MTKHITELCLVGESRPLPFAVLVEHENECAWAVATDYYYKSEWAGHVLAKKERRETEAWLLESWVQWLGDASTAAPEARHKALRRLEQSTPGIIVRKPRRAYTNLPASVVAASWQRRRLHDRAETVAANIAHRLAGSKGKTHWDSAIHILEQAPITADWIVESMQQNSSSNERDMSHLSVIRVIEVADVLEQKAYWANMKGSVLPFAVAIVRGIKTVEILEEGCFIGDRFPAAESLATSIIRSKWGMHRASHLGTA